MCLFECLFQMQKWTPFLRRNPFNNNSKGNADSKNPLVGTADLNTI